MPRITPKKRARTYIEWIGRTNLVPSSKSPDPEERALADSYAFLRGKTRSDAEDMAFLQMTDARDAARKALREAGEGRRSFTSKGMITARRIEAFHQETGRLPRHSNEEERSLYGGLRNLRHRKAIGELPAETIAVLERIPGAFNVVRKPPLPELEKLEAWCAANKRMPRYDIKNQGAPEDDFEVHLGRWLYRRLNRRHNPVETPESQLIRARIRALQETYPPTSAAKASAEAREVLDFISAKGRLPDWHHECLLFMQAASVRRTFTGRTGLFGADIADFLAATEALPSAAVSRWDGWFTDLQDFVQAEGRLPSGVFTQGPERELAEWLVSAHLTDDRGRNDALARFLAGWEDSSAA